jgi:hypothetical protein
VTLDPVAAIKREAQALTDWYVAEKQALLAPLNDEHMRRYVALKAACKAAGGHFWNVRDVRHVDGAWAGPPEMCAGCGFSDWWGEERDTWKPLTLMPFAVPVDN